MYAITTYITQFNRANLIVAVLRLNISAALALEEGFASEFYMASCLLDVVCARFASEFYIASYLLDVVCARCQFEG